MPGAVLGTEERHVLKENGAKKGDRETGGPVSYRWAGKASPIR